MKIILYIIVVLIITCFSCKNEVKTQKKIPDVLRVEQNYGKEIERISKTFDLPAEYIKALAVLECSGEKTIVPRFEQNVYNKLVDLKLNKIQKFENITHDFVKNLNDNILRDMATSWGALQIMGYKCVWLNINVDELKGKNNLFYSIKWIDETYGKYVRELKLKDAFHIHNAGKLYPDTGPPLTYNPNYVKNGLKYYKYFLSKKAQKNEIKNNFEVKIDSTGIKK